MSEKDSELLTVNGGGSLVFSSYIVILHAASNTVANPLTHVQSERTNIASISGSCVGSGNEAILPSFSVA